MEKVTGEGRWISLGPWGPEGWSRRSRCEASYKADGHVMEITVHYSELSPISDTESIDAISFQSKSRDVVVIGCSEIGSSRCQRTQKVLIDDSVEKLLSITLTYNTFYITSLTFHTNLNKYGPIGPFDEKDTTFSMPMDVGVIVGFHGCGEVDRNNCLLAIGVYVVPKVESLHSIQDPNYGPSQDKKKIEEELKLKIKELEDKVDAKNEVLRKRNEEMTKAAADLQKIEEDLAKLKKEMEDVAAENEALRKRNEVMEKKIKLGEGGIPLGPWGGKGGSDWAYKTNVAPIMEITLTYGAIIDSVLFRNYRRFNGDVVGCSNRIGGTGGHKHKTFFINSSTEQLTSISLTHKDLYGEETITSLCFYSNRASYGPYGTVCGFAVSIPIEGAVLTGFHGRFGTFLNAIGIFVAPKVLNS